MPMRKVIIFLCAILFFLTTEGQSLENKIQELSGYVADSSIVREWKNGYCVMYTSTAGEDYYFHLIDVLSGTVWSIASQDRVSDMEIIGDTLYYCGNDYIGFPTVGVFYIPNILTNNVIVSHLRCPTRHTIVPERMDVVRVSNGFHVFVTGDLTYEGSSIPVSFVADVANFNTVSSNWTVRYYVTWGKECFDDVAATENYVVTAGHVDNSRDVIIRVFERPNNVNYPSDPNPSHHHMFYNPALCNYMYFYSGNAMKPMSQHDYYSIFITHTKADTVAVAYLADYSAYFGLTVKTIDVSTGVPIPQKEINAKGIPEKYNVKDIRYDKLADSLLILQEKNSSVYGATRGYMVITDNGTFSTLLEIEPTWGIWIRSIDKFHALSKSKIFCGEELWDGLNTPMLNTSAFDGSSCFVRTPVLFYDDTFKLLSYPLTVSKMDHLCPSYYYIPTTIVSTLNTICYENID